jgi:hypothetical protein
MQKVSIVAAAWAECIPLLTVMEWVSFPVVMTRRDCLAPMAGVAARMAWWLL